MPPSNEDTIAIRSVVICNDKGLHARAAAKFVETAGFFDAEVTVEREGQEVAGDSIMGLLMLAAAKGAPLTITARGAEAAAAAAALVDLVENKFNESDQSTE